MAAPDGWVQIIRGPRPPSVKWPAASEGSVTTKKQGVGGVPRSQARGRWRQPFAQVSSEVSFEAAQRRVAQLEGALRAFGDARGPEVTVVQESLKAAKRAAQVPPVKVQLAHCEQFVARAEERLATHDEEQILLVKQLEDGKQRLLKRRVRGAGCEFATDGQHSAVGAGCSCGADSGREGRRVIARNRRQTTHTTGVGPGQHIPAIDGPRRAFLKVGRQTGGFEGRFCQGGRCWGSLVDVKDGTRCRAVDSVDTSARNDRRRARVAGSSWRWEIRSVLSVVVGATRRSFLSVNAKYGLQGVRIREEANPGPASRRRRAQRLRALQWSWDSDTEIR